MFSPYTVITTIKVDSLKLVNIATIYYYPMY
jgi:hypothetical protein